MTAKTLYDCTREDLISSLVGQPRYRVDQIYRALYAEFKSPSEMTTLPNSLRTELDIAHPCALAPVTESVSDDGSTIKFLWELSGGSRIETVLMHYPDRATVCVSTQSGCAMACGFCATGQAGFTRHLTAGEIVEQVVRASRRARDANRRVTNIVYMGMGEPLANEEPVWQSLVRVHDDIGISARHLTVSTVGIVPGIERLADRPLPVNLAVSLHAANDELRNELVPINRRYPLASLVQACGNYLEKKGRRLTFEWALISDVNDRPQDAYELADLCRSLRIPAHVNLIPLNPTPGYLVRGSSPDRVRAFCDRLQSLGVNATIRRNRGTDIAAACGQLAAGQPVRITTRRS
ncbi:MAG: 23S rRNA (adenine(2503)-C(2))-methyltransferase RlmN [Actinomycetota bacterium]